MSSAIRRFLWIFLLSALLIPARSTFAGGPTHSVRFVNRCVQQVWLAELAPSATDDPAKVRAQVQTLTLFGLRGLGVVDARARGLVVQTALPPPVA